MKNPKKSSGTEGAVAQERLKDIVRSLVASPNRDGLTIRVEGVQVEIRIRSDGINADAGCERKDEGSGGPLRRFCGFPVCAGDQAIGFLRPQVRDLYCLTEREAEVAVLVAQGYQNAEIARRLGTAVSTVKRHVYNVFNKVGVDNRTHLVHRLRCGVQAAYPSGPNQLVVGKIEVGQDLPLHLTG
jgi:DNA-binding CsgD family transcriptional regulator